EACGQSSGEAAGQVAQHAAAGDMSGAFPPDASEIVEIGPVRLEDHLPERSAELRENVAQWHVLEHLAHERVAVGVEAAGWQSDEHVARRDRVALRSRFDQA